MRTKLKITTSLFLFISLFIFSQTEDLICGTPDDISLDPQNAYSYSIDLEDLQAFEPVVLNVFFWGIN